MLKSGCLMVSRNAQAKLKSAWLHAHVEVHMKDVCRCVNRCYTLPWDFLDELNERWIERCKNTKEAAMQYITHLCGGYTLALKWLNRQSLDLKTPAWDSVHSFSLKFVHKTQRTKRRINCNSWSDSWKWKLQLERGYHFNDGDDDKNEQLWYESY